MEYREQRDIYDLRQHRLERDLKHDRDLRVVQENWTKVMTPEPKNSGFRYEALRFLRTMWWLWAMLTVYLTAVSIWVPRGWWEATAADWTLTVAMAVLTTWSFMTRRRSHW